MKRKLKANLFLYSVCALVGTSLVACSSADDPEEKEEIVITSTTTTTVPPTTTIAPETTTTTTQPTLPAGFSMPTLPPDVPCQEWTQVALDAGWPWELLPELLREVWSESRCQNIIEGHKNFNGWDRGPLQINQVWLNEIEDKYGHWEYVKDPRYNFAWGWEMYKWYDHRKGCGFIPWSRPCK